MVIEIDVWVEMNLVDCNKHDTIEVEIDDDASESAIERACEEAYQDWVWNHINGGWIIKEE